MKWAFLVNVVAFGVHMACQLLCCPMYIFPMTLCIILYFIVSARDQFATSGPRSKKHWLMDNLTNRTILCALLSQLAGNIFLIWARHSMINFAVGTVLFLIALVFYVCLLFRDVRLISFRSVVWVIPYAIVGCFVFEVMKPALPSLFMSILIAFYAAVILFMSLCALLRGITTGRYTLFYFTLCSLMENALFGLDTFDVLLPLSKWYGHRFGLAAVHPFYVIGMWLMISGFLEEEKLAKRE